LLHLPCTISASETGASVMAFEAAFTLVPPSRDGKLRARGVATATIRISVAAGGAPARRWRREAPI
jgi:hypothetical protein